MAYYGDHECSEFVPFGSKYEIALGNRTTLVKNLGIDYRFEQVSLYNKHNNQEFIYAYDVTGNQGFKPTFRIWMSNGEGAKFDIDYWLDKIVDKI